MKLIFFQEVYIRKFLMISIAFVPDNELIIEIDANNSFDIQ